MYLGIGDSENIIGLDTSVKSREIASIQKIVPFPYILTSDRELSSNVGLRSLSKSPTPCILAFFTQTPVIDSHMASHFLYGLRHIPPTGSFLAQNAPLHLPDA